MKPLFLISKSLDLQILASLIASVEAYVHCKRDQRDEALPPLYMVHKGDALFFFGLSPIYTLQLAAKFGFQPQTSKPDNFDPPTLEKVQLSSF
jgi:hypothetical protein